MSCSQHSFKKTKVSDFYISIELVSAIAAFRTVHIRLTLCTAYLVNYVKRIYMNFIGKYFKVNRLVHESLIFIFLTHLLTSECLSHFIGRYLSHREKFCDLVLFSK